MKSIIFFIASVSAVLVPTMAVAENIDPENDDHQYSYGENVGWLNADPATSGENGVDVDDGALTGYIWAENIGWISLSCENTGSCSTVEYGVVNDGSGNLSGYAWSENTGWINYSCDTNDTCGVVAYGITIDPITGDFSGHAWGENIGWLTFDFAVNTDYHTRTYWRIDGDISSDGSVTLVDAIMTLQVNTGQNTSFPIHTGADVDGNDKLGIEESIYILNKVAM